MDRRRTRRAAFRTGRALSRALIVLALGWGAGGGLGCASAPAASDAADGAIELFDGRTLDGWVRRGGAAEYHVENGAIVGETRPDQPNTFLCTTAEFDDFELEFEFLVDAEANSGVQFRSRSVPEYRRGVVHGYQYEIDPSARSWTGGIYEEGRRGWLDDLQGDPAARAAFRPGAWNRARVRAEGARIKTWINGELAGDLSDFHPDALHRGFIALQVHGVGKRADPLRVRWRAIRLRPLVPAPQKGG
jgi:hypothetical protein